MVTTSTVIEKQLKELFCIQSQMRELIVLHVLGGEPLADRDYVEDLVARSNKWWAEQDAEVVGGR